MQKYIDKNVELDFINSKQLNKDEKIIFARHCKYYDDILGDDDNYFKVLTIATSGTVYCYLKNINGNWYKRFY